MFNIYEQVTNTIVTAIESGMADGKWKAPWRHLTKGGLPVNAKTNIGYKGGNTLLLWIVAESKGYGSGYWATFKQWNELGAKVKKGEKAVQGYFWDRRTGTKVNENGEDEEFSRFICKPFWVFNAAQVEGWTPPNPEELPEPEKIERAEAIVSANPVPVQYGGNRACYIPALDRILSPERRQFKSAHDFYSTMFHEFGHSTGHKDRLNRVFGKRFGDDAYAMEELVAELCAAFVCAQCQISVAERPDHAQYINSWLKKLREDSRAIFTAASAAQKAADFILAYK